MNKLIAHVMKEGCELREEPLKDHLDLVSKLACRFASDLGLQETSVLLGCVHDLGKASREFQEYIRATGRSGEDADNQKELEDASTNWKKGPDHATAGARWLVHESGLPPQLGVLLAYTVAGHHAGLPDGLSTSHGCLSYRVEKKVLPDWQSLGGELPPARIVPFDHLIAEFSHMSLRDELSCAGRVRMLFSALVDADFLATEQFMDPDRSGLRNHISPSIEGLEKQLARYLARFDKARQPSPVDSVRHEIREACLKAAEEQPGLFTLEVPTGGGKTLSSIAFALRHARLHGLRHIIYVIPYTSIIEQNAEVFRRIFGEDVILEHHSNRDPDLVGERTKLLTENWDAPIIVTTNVQFFESLYSNKTSRCRKLHNLAKSVIVMDEAQSLPAPLLRPCLHALDELICNCGSTIVMCTATLPAFFRGDFSGTPGQPHRWNGLAGNAAGCRNIATGLDLERRLVRVDVQVLDVPISDRELADRLTRETSVLAIVSTRKHARRLYEYVREFADAGQKCFHLSAQMCPAHRLDIIAEIRERLGNNEPCLVVSTQLIEAGVDLDFPCVYREKSGCDAMVQAAGRCNREGRLGRGRVVLFESAEKNSIPSGDLAQSAEKGKEILSLGEFALQPLSSAAVQRFFQLRYNDLDSAGELDRYRIGSKFRIQDNGYGFDFKACAEAFKLIPESGIVVYVPYGEVGRDLCEQFRNSFAPGDQREILRRLGRYGVTIHGLEPRTADGNLYAEKVHDLVWIMTSPELYYSADFGLTAEPLDQLLQI